MPASIRSHWTLVTFGAALVLSGCQRTQDGSYEISKARMKDMVTIGRAAPPEQRMAMADYPPAPAREDWLLNRRADQVDNWRPAPARRSAGIPVAAAAKSLSCHDETGAGGRVRVVCD